MQYQRSGSTTQISDKATLNELITPYPSYAALIFDCDGTIAHTLPVHCQIWAMIFRKFGVEVSEAWYSDHTGLSANELIAAFNDSFGCVINQDRVNAERQQHFLNLIHHVQEVEAVAAISRANQGKVPMAVASNGQRSIVEPTIEAIGLRSLFHTIVTLDDVDQGKPAPDLFLLAAERMGVAPYECIVYEDSDAGLEAARRAGMRWIDVRILWRT